MDALPDSKAGPELPQAKAPPTTERSQAEAQAAPRREAHETTHRIVRAEDLPPLPPDAFEILTSYVRDA
jgi:hypothetical protein